MKNSDKPAFIQCDDTHMKKSALDVDVNYGLTKREYFAGLAMQGFLSQSGIYISDTDGTVQEKFKNEVATQSIQFADELLKLLDK